MQRRTLHYNTLYVPASFRLDDSCDCIQTPMEQWLELRSTYLHILLEMEGRPSITPCSMCNKQADIKCPDCYGETLFCQDCCLVAHRRSPFHRPLQWTISHYTQVSLHSLGFSLCLGHAGAPCPKTVEVLAQLAFGWMPMLTII